MQGIQTRNLARLVATKGYTWQSDEAAMVNALIGAVWHHEMDQRTGIKSKVSNMFRKVGLGRRRSTW